MCGLCLQHRIQRLPGIAPVEEDLQLCGNLVGCRRLIMHLLPSGQGQTLPALDRLCHHATLRPECVTCRFGHWETKPHAKQTVSLRSADRHNSGSHPVSSPRCLRHPDPRVSAHQYPSPVAGRWKSASAHDRDFIFYSGRESKQQTQFLRRNIT